MDAILDWLVNMRKLLEIPLVSVGEKVITLWAVIYLLVLVVALFWISALAQRWVSRGLLARSPLDASARHAVGAISRYLLLLIGLLIIVQTAGIDLTTFNVVAGAIGIGVGFGLQNVVSNFFAGLIIMFERPIKVGDRIEVGNIDGDVIEIGARATTVLTNDNIAIIVPNSKFISENVVNWKYNDARVRFRIPVAVAYGSDAAEIERLLMEVAKNDPDVLDSPEPAVRLLKFGDNGLEFELRAWTSSQVHRRGRLVSALNLGIYKAFNEASIEFPFPQRDLHVRGGVLEVRQVGEKEPGDG